ncbi:MAG: saccharopine dehydrogenase NADP-binding domain-containing protein [Myxococcota bacterium]
MTERTWMLYGANGYTGELIAEEARRRGMTPVLAGRRAEAIRPIAERLGLPWRAFPVDTPEAVVQGMHGVAVMLLAAGPFTVTSAPVVEACLRTGTHYLDITGEIPVFEACHRRDAEARARGCVVLPGVGFDVVPSDCLAASLAQALPGATHLELAFSSSGGFSKGTAKTVVQNLSEGGAIRRDGVITSVPMGWRSKRIPFADHPRTAMSIPWGDVSTAFHSTGIPNIVVYMATPRRMVQGAKLVAHVTPVLALSPVKELLKRVIDKAVKGPDEQTRRTARAQLWGRVEDASGRSVEGTLTTPEGYQLTVLTAVEAVARVLKGNVKPGALTPSKAFGAGFITEFAGCELRIHPVGARA